MKKIIIHIVLVMLCFPVFCQNEKTNYSQVMESAKQYADNNEWVHAMGSYIDTFANETFTFDERQKAYEEYCVIANKIQYGNPGLGDFDEFVHLDQWEALMDEFVDYQNETFIIRPEFGNLEKQNSDYEKRVVNYSASIKFRYTNKFKLIADNLLKGLGNGAKEEWRGSFRKYSHGDWSVYYGVEEPNEGYYYPHNLIYKITFVLKDSEGNQIGDPYNRFISEKEGSSLKKDMDVYNIGYKNLQSFYEGFTSDISKKIESGNVSIIPTSITANGKRIKDSEVIDFLKTDDNVLSFIEEIQKVKEAEKNQAKLEQEAEIAKEEEAKKAEEKREQESKLAKEKQKKQEETNKLDTKQAELIQITKELKVKYPELVENIIPMTQSFQHIPLNDFHKFVKFINNEIKKTKYSEIKNKTITFVLEDIKSEIDLIKLGSAVQDADFPISIFVYNNEFISIPLDTFDHCNTLQWFEMNKVDNISEKAFNNCPTLFHVTIFELNNMEKNAFVDCARLDRIDLPKKIKSKIKKDYQDYIKKKIIKFN